MGGQSKKGRQDSCWKQTLRWSRLLLAVVLMAPIALTLHRVLEVQTSIHGQDEAVADDDGTEPEEQLVPKLVPRVDEVPRKTAKKQEKEEKKRQGKADRKKKKQKGEKKHQGREPKTNSGRAEELTAQAPVKAPAARIEQPWARPPAAGEARGDLPPEAAAEPLVSCRGPGGPRSSSESEPKWETVRQKAMNVLCESEKLRPLMEVFLDTRFLQHYTRFYDDTGWCRQAWVNYATAREKPGKRRNGYSNKLTDEMVASVHRWSRKPVVVVNFGPKNIPFLDPAKYPRMVLLHARALEGASFSFNGLRAAVLSKVMVGAVIEEDMLFVSSLADGLLDRTSEEITEDYPFPMLPTHFLDRDPANEKRRFGNYLKYTVNGARDPLFPKPTLRWGQQQATWTYWALPFVARWLSARLQGQEYMDVPTRHLGESEDLLNVGLWREGATKCWCLWQQVGVDFVYDNYIPQREIGAYPLNADPLRFPKGVPIAFYWAWAEGSMDKYAKAVKALDKVAQREGAKPKAYFHAKKFYDTFADLKADDPEVQCLL